jgi:hypothetical protein
MTMKAEQAQLERPLSPTASRREAAAALIEEQLASGARVLQERPIAKIRVSALAYQAAERFYKQNQMGLGPKPEGVFADSVRELMAAGVLSRQGHARGTRYVLLNRPNELFRDPTHVHSEPRTIKARTESVASPKAREKAILTIGEREKAYIREHVRDYLAFATSLEARKHEERRQSEEILDSVHARSKELLRASKSGSGPRLTPLEAARRAQVEVDLDFDQLLRAKWLPIMFDLFGMEESADTDMKTAKL